ncbi:hypothetical protein RhiirB3_450993 [Rhizophagus irregularis]|nr:hypothetical protein RhiirB3_450993 [Rhizophagus irregularis]
MWESLTLLRLVNRIEAYEISQKLNREIVPLNIYDSINFSDKIENYDDQAVHDEMELQGLINQLPFDDPINVKEFLHIDDFLKKK